MYFIPNAQFVVFDHEKILVQTSCKEEIKYGDEIINDTNIFTVKLYNITNDKILYSGS